LERLLDDSLEVPDLFSDSKLGEKVCSGVAFPRYVVHLKAFKIVNKSFENVVVLEQHCFLGLVSVGNMPLNKLRVCVAS